MATEASVSDSDDNLHDLEDGNDEWVEEDEDEVGGEPMDEDIPNSTPAVPSQPKDPNGMSLRVSYRARRII